MTRYILLQAGAALAAILAAIAGVLWQPDQGVRTNPDRSNAATALCRYGADFGGKSGS